MDYFVNVTPFASSTILGGVVLFLVVCWYCYRLMQKKKYILLLLWPVVIYFCGPMVTTLFADAPGLGSYVFPDSIFDETLMMFLYFICFVIADRFLGISKVIESSTSSLIIRSLAQSRAFPVIFFSMCALSAILQINMLLQFGSVLSGAYVLDNVAEGLIPYWGFLAGLYEIIFLCFILFILSDIQHSKYRIAVVSVYCISALLRIAGGTRLILVKELAFVLLLLYLRGGIKKRSLAIAVAVTILVGSAVGLMRTQGSGEVNLFGPLYGVVMESGLNALTLNIAYHVQDSGFISSNDQTWETPVFLLLSSIPSFLRLGISQSELATMSPYDQALQFGFDTSTPVGGMSGFATICYLSSYPLLCTVGLVAIIGFLIRFTSRSSLKNVIVFCFAINAIHFWRDPIDIAVKLVVQDIVCVFVLWFFIRGVLDKRPILYDLVPTRQAKTLS